MSYPLAELQFLNEPCIRDGTGLPRDLAGKFFIAGIAIVPGQEPSIFYLHKDKRWYQSTTTDGDPLAGYFGTREGAGDVLFEVRATLRKHPLFRKDDWNIASFRREVLILKK